MDQELRDLINELRDLNLLLKAMSKAPGQTEGANGNKSADKLGRGVDQMVVALAQLAVKLDTTKRTRAAEEEAVKQFVKAVDKSTEAIDKEAKAREESTKEQEKRDKEQAELDRRSKMSQLERDKEDYQYQLKKQKEDRDNTVKKVREEAELHKRSKGSVEGLFDSLSSTGGTAEVLKSKLSSLGGESVGAQVGLRLLYAGTEGAAKGLKTFSTGLLEGQRGAQLSAKAMTDFATPILNVADALGGILTVASFFVGGPLVKFAMRAGGALLGLGSAAGSAALKLNELGAKQLDTLFKSFNDLSGAGIGLTSGLEGTLDLMHTLNMTTAEAAQFNELLGKSTKQLAQMGGTAAMGAERFAKVSGALVKSDLGEQFERMGITQQEQREAALLYMSIQARTGQLQLKNIQQLTEESGKFVQELDMAAQLTGTTRREQQEAREAAMTETRFRAALVDARQRGDTEDQKQLEIAQRTSAILKSMGDEKGAVGVLQQAAGQGALTTPEAIAAEQTYRISEILAQPNITDQQILDNLAKNGQISQQQFAATNRLIGGIDTLQTSVVGTDNVVLRQMSLAEGATEAGFTGPDNITKFLEQQDKKRKAPDGDMSLMVGAGRAQQSAAQMMEKSINIFNVAAEINHTASKAFDTAVKKFGDIMGVKVAGGTATSQSGAAPAAVAPSVAQATQAHQQQQIKIKNVEEQALAAEDRAKALEKDAKASREEKDAARAKADEIAAQLAQESRLLRQTQLEEQNARRAQRKETVPNSGATPGSATVPPSPPLKDGNLETPESIAAAMKAGAVAPPPAGKQAASPAGGAPSTASGGRGSAVPPSPGAAAPARGAAPAVGAAPAKPTAGSPPGVSAEGEQRKPTPEEKAQGKGGGSLKIGPNADMSGLDNEMISRLQKFAESTGKSVDVNSAYRSDQKQAELWVRGNILNESGIYTPAAPKDDQEVNYKGKTYHVKGSGKGSLHGVGNAVDISVAGMGKSKGPMDELLANAGLFRPFIAKDYPHVQMMAEGGIVQPTPGGTPAIIGEGGSAEAVIPLKNGAVPVMMPALDELVSSNRAVDAQVQVLRNEMGSMMRELVNAIQTMKETGSQERMIQLLESMSRSQQTTAAASQRMAQLASN
jgi:hypothetical protein